MAGGPFEGMLMKIQFDDPLFEAWTQRPILTIAEGGAEIGEIKATAARIPDGDRRPTVCPGRGMRRPWCADQRALSLSAGVNVLSQFLSAVVRPADRSPRQVRLCTRGGGFCPRRGAVRSTNHADGHSIRGHHPARLVLFRRRGKAPTSDLH